MKLIVGDCTISVGDKYILSSPYLSSMVRKEEVVLNDVSLDIVYQYVHFLYGKPFTLTEKVAKFFNRMGHINTLEYPLDVWRMKLRDNWIRDNFYRLELWRDPYYGLTEVPIVRKLDLPLEKGFYVAGGAALWMAGVIDGMSDIDIFTTLPEEEANEHLLFLNEEDERYAIYRKDGTICNNKYNVTVNGYTISYDLYSPNTTVQYILRLYQSPSEIVHGFDLDCVGILYDGEKLWVTERCMMSIKEKMNWLDPTRSSPSYVYRLIKYIGRGFDVYLPLFNMNMYRKKEASRLIVDIHDIYRECIDNKEIISIYDAITINTDELMSTSKEHREYQMYIGRMFNYIRHRDEIRDLDHVTLLLLAKFRGIYCTYNIKCSDYKTRFSRHREGESNTPFKIDPSRIRWKRQNPMEQVTTTFTPMPINDLDDWYRTSILYY